MTEDDEITVEMPLAEYAAELTAARLDGRDDATVDVERLAQALLQLTAAVGQLTPQPAAQSSTTPRLIDLFSADPESLLRTGGIARALRTTKEGKSQ